MNLTVDNIIETEEIIELISSFLHDTTCSNLEIDGKDKFFKCKIKRYYYEGRQKKKSLLGLVSSIVCPSISTELVIGPIADCCSKDKTTLDALSSAEAYFLFFRLKKDHLKIEFTTGTIEIILIPNTALILKDISSPSEKSDNLFWGHSSEVFNEFNKLTQSSCL